MANTNETNYYGVGVYGGATYGGEEQFDLEQTARSKRYREQWEECSRCGFTYPLSQLRLQQGDGGSVVVCVSHCLDEPSREDLRPNEYPTEAPLSFVDDGGPST